MTAVYYAGTGGEALCGLIINNELPCNFNNYSNFPPNSKYVDCEWRSKHSFVIIAIGALGTFVICV